MTENETVQADSEVINLVPPTKKPFWQKKYVIAIAAATAAVLVGGYFLSKAEPFDPEDDGNDEPSETEEVLTETPEL